MTSYLTTTTAATQLGVTATRVRALIAAGRLKATLSGRDWLIAPRDLEAVRDRRPGRPPARMPALDNQAQSLAGPFRELVERWKDETGHSSSITKALANPNYLRIIGLAGKSTGHELERLLLRELESDPDHWFAALSAITGEDPVHPGHDFDQAVKAWIQWGRKKGIV